MTGASKKPRAGQTEKISISVAKSDLSVLRRRARRLYGGNISAAVAEGARRIQEEEGREALLSWLGDAGRASAAERNAIRAEWNAPVVAAPSQRTRKAR